MPETWNGLLDLQSSYPADPNLGVNPTLLRQGAGEPWLLLDAAASALTLPAAPQGLCWWAQQLRETIPAGGTLSSGANAWHQTKASVWPRLRTCLGRTLGQPRCLILMGIACTEAWGPQPCRSFSHVLGQIGFLLTPSKALGQDKGLSRQESTGPGLSLGLSFAGVWHCSKIQARRRRKCWDSWSEAVRLRRAQGGLCNLVQKLR